MRDEWEMRALADVCLTIQDGAHESPKVQFDAPGEGRFPYITSKHIRVNYLDLEDVSYVDRAFHDRIYPRCQPSVGDVLLTKDGANTGNVTLNTLDEPLSLLSSVCLIKTNPAVLIPSFLSYYLQSPDGLMNITGQMSGAAIRRIILRDIKRATIPIPPLTEQHRIVGVLDEALARIVTARENAEKNLRNARALFEGHIASVLGHSRGRCPEGRLGDVCNTSSGGTPLKSRREYYEGGTIPWLLSGEVAQGEVREATRFITEDGLNASSAKVFPANTVLVAMYGATAGQVGILRFEATTNQAICGIFPNKDFIPEFLLYLLLSKKAMLVAQAAGNAQPNISQAKIRSLAVPLLSLMDQRRVVERLASSQTETKRLERVYQRKLTALEELRQSFLDEAFRGRLTKKAA